MANTFSFSQSFLDEVFAMMKSTFRADSRMIQRWRGLSGSAFSCQASSPNAPVFLRPRAMPVASDRILYEPSRFRDRSQNWLWLPGSADHWMTGCSSAPLALSSAWNEKPFTSRKRSLPRGVICQTWLGLSASGVARTIVVSVWTLLCASSTRPSGVATV